MTSSGYISELAPIYARGIIVILLAGVCIIKFPSKVSALKRLQSFTNVLEAHTVGGPKTKQVEGVSTRLPPTLESLLFLFFKLLCLCIVLTFPSLSPPFVDGNDEIIQTRKDAGRVKDCVSDTLSGLIFSRINFHKFREFCLFSRK